MQNSGMGFTRTYAGQSIPVWQRDKGMLLYQGGFVLVNSAGTPFPGGSTIKAGTPGVVDEVARTFTIGNFAILYAAASNSATQYQVNKGHLLAIGNDIAALTGGASEPITAIDTSNAAYDLITVGTTLGVALGVGAPVFQSPTAGSTAGALPAFNGLLYEETYIDYPYVAGASSSIGGYVPACSVVQRGTVYAKRVPYTSQIAALPGLAHIIYSQSY